MTITDIHFCYDSEQFIDTACEAIFDAIMHSQSEDFLISLSGGKTPLPVYKAFAQKARKKNLEQRLFFIQTDERNVATDSDRSNKKAILNSLFNNDGLPADHFFPVIPGMNDYETSFEHCFKGLPEHLLPPRPIDLAIMGTGNDGHTASLFPDTDWQSSKTETGYQSFITDSQPEPRISLNLDRLLQARAMIFLVTGNQKKEALKRALSEKDSTIPAGYLCARRNTLWALDQQASQSFKELE